MWSTHASVFIIFMPITPYCRRQFVRGFCCLGQQPTKLDDTLFLLSALLTGRRHAVSLQGWIDAELDSGLELFGNHLYKYRRMCEREKVTS